MQPMLAAILSYSTGLEASVTMKLNTMDWVVLGS